MSLLLLLLACLLTCLGQVAQKFAVESWRDRPSALRDKLRSPWLWLALASLGLGLLVWLLVLQRMEVGVAYPMLSLNFVLITLIARFVFHEHIDRRHWLGVALVIGGVALLSQHA
ncbi:4-amino-4-deoxy-L-arabinose-phospho-UDP flippase [Pseudomonas chlororaphis]|jgi:undecaprenyl phosphate-alpha-L-ara4N flippase subunit ArnE|uniref:Probable 4-amino-4-deoxy-L-arabinose-phosphoundecaprenol flippase subunit ArnE n=1 Tax=Pseudomonas morbosilactucae TaxID=2938197 RepID=A0A9X2C420_9PSED|nr:4-amino-4-deoxy-L-arabinose-phosphoundecaprenol flippase subunit ArnE [Pseudomonas morbosilactucae]MCK9796595.1 4-amino-4-deoxy-L-arabinose-phosphoundecaprenol flippase subunit ArnE [Pseudomonas morbosilactucae]MCK9813774.1 4-amino-4-deoxy-L-arabinose-phosphoundecaprenol flippase subunit ArnE [Pseudomonas morbosilactucae]ROL69729.1 4-amino-4-deoxy-L-arabinose-phospho-UDP flippase [Pseudomonas chlororaphis]WEK07288.1 MAG: 4-amino-4-deoxy-L-arabinose-phosphoundecaprenol flippase subunit ArnE [